MMASDTPSIEDPSYYRDTKLQQLQQSLDLHRHHNNHHQDRSSETEFNSNLKNVMTSYSELDQHLNTFNQHHNDARIFYQRVSGTSRIRDDFGEDVIEHIMHIN